MQNKKSTCTVKTMQIYFKHIMGITGISDGIYIPWPWPHPRPLTFGEELVLGNISQDSHYHCRWDLEDQLRLHHLLPSNSYTISSSLSSPFAGALNKNQRTSSLVCLVHQSRHLELTRSQQSPKQILNTQSSNTHGHASRLPCFLWNAYVIYQVTGSKGLSKFCTYRGAP